MSAYRPVGPWVLLVLAAVFCGVGGFLVWTALRVDYAFGLFLVTSGVCGILFGLLALVEFPEQVRQRRLERRERRADLWIEDALDRAARRDNERTAA